MPSYSDDDSPSRDRRGHGPSQDYDKDNDARSPAASNQGSKTGRRPTRDQYDASDEEDESPKRRHRSLPIRRRGEPGIPHPPLGEDRGEEPSKDQSSRRRRQNGDFDDATRPRRGQTSKNGLDGDDEDDDRYVGRRGPREDEGRYGDATPSPRRSGRDRPLRNGDDNDENPGVGRRRSLRQPRDRDDYEARPPRRKSLGRDFAPANDSRRRRDLPRYPDDDVARPRRHREDRPRYDDGYGTDRPRRRPRDDDHERGYRTDGRDPRRDRRRGDDRRDRHDRDKDRRRDSARHYDNDDHRGSRRKGSKDLNGLIETGKKHWNTVEPIAKPLLAQLAKTYLEGHGK